MTGTKLGKSTIHEATAAVSITAVSGNKTPKSIYDLPIHMPVPQVASNIPINPILPIPYQPHAPKLFTTEFYQIEHFAATEPHTIDAPTFQSSKSEPLNQNRAKHPL